MTCTQGCDHGWVAVGPDYINRHWPLPAPMKFDDDPEVYRKHLAVIEIKRVSAEGAVYPCPDCCPVQYDRWATA